MSRPQAEPRSAYKAFRSISTRWSDNDAYGHVNNVVYYQWFDTAVNAWLIDKGLLDVQAGEVIGLVVETQCNCFEPLAFPQGIEAGLRVAQVGRSSVRFEVGIFAERAKQRGPRPFCACVCRPADRSAAGAARPLFVRLEGTPVSTLKTNLVDDAITSRMSARAFLPDPVPRATLMHLLEVASRAPSGTNTQPWKVYVLQGDKRDALVSKVCAAHDAIRAQPELAAEFKEEYGYYPEKWVSPYIDRRRENGWGLYGLLGIGKADKDKMHAQHQRNYRFFDAPVGLMFTMDRVMGRGSLMDYGMFMQNIMVAARGHGLHTCPQAAWNGFAKIILPHIGAGPDEMLVCGMSLGYADPAALVNSFRTPRVPASEFTHFV